MSSLDYRYELQRLVAGLDVNRYYDAWRLALVLWRSVWYRSATDWRRYRMDIWSMFTERLQSAARTTGDLDSFLSRFGKLMSLSEIAVNEDDRVEVARMLALEYTERQHIMRMLREDTAVIVVLVRRWKDARREERAEAESAFDLFNIQIKEETE